MYTGSFYYYYYQNNIDLHLFSPLLLCILLLLVTTCKGCWTVNLFISFPFVRSVFVILSQLTTQISRTERLASQDWLTNQTEIRKSCLILFCNEYFLIMFVGLFASVCLSYFITLVEAHLCLFTLTSFYSPLLTFLDVHSWELFPFNYIMMMNKYVFYEVCVWVCVCGSIGNLDHGKCVLRGESLWEGL